MEAQLRAEIAANPDDDAPRMVYADLLVERGDPRGELIHLQIKQLRGGYAREVEERIGELMRAHEAQWKAEAGITDALSSFSRGFPASLIGSAASILASREALRTQPITSVSILSRLAGFEDVMQMPELARVSSLTISGEMGSYRNHAVLTAAQVEALARAPHLSNLRELWLKEAALDVAGARILATAPWLPAIEKLVLGKNPLHGAGVAALAPKLIGLRHLTLDDVDVSREGMAALAASPIRRLDSLYLAGARLDDGGVALATSPVMATVRHLNLDRTYPDNALAAALATSPHVTALRELGLTNGSIDVAGATALANSTALVALERLDLRENLLGHAGVAALAAGTGLRALRRLGLTGNGIGTGRYETHESPEYSASYEVQESIAELAARVPHRPGLVIE
jgi:uncharacterized protein (TIGR02996 family)